MIGYNWGDMLEWIPFPEDRRQRLVLFGVYVLFIAVLSLTPSDTRTLPVKHIDKVGHFLAYVVMAVLALVCFEERRGKVAAVLLTVVLAVLLEWGQGFVPGRLMTLTDGVTNVLGLGVGYLIHWFYWRRLSNSGEEPQIR
jgi:VanZ family protein